VNLTWNWAHFFIGAGVWFAVVWIMVTFVSIGGISDKRYDAAVKEHDEKEGVSP
jgi:hypothetical protein